MAGAAGALARLCIHKKKSVDGVGRVADINNFDELVDICKKIATELHTLLDIREYPEYGWARISFETDHFGGTYVNLHYDFNTGEIVNWYGHKDAQLINTEYQLRSLVKKELKKELKARNFEALQDMLDSEY